MMKTSDQQIALVEHCSLLTGFFSVTDPTQMALEGYLQHCY